MTEPLREQLSAFMDGATVPESSLAQLVQNDELKASWARYHLVRDVMHNELSLPAGDLASRISAALDAEPTVLAPKAKKPLPVPGFFRQAASFAVAASVTAAVIFGVQSYNAQQAGTPALAQQTVTPAPVMAQQPPVLMVGPMVQAASARTKPLDPRQERLREYLMDHTQQSNAQGVNGVLPYVKVVSHEPNER